MVFEGGVAQIRGKNMTARISTSLRWKAGGLDINGREKAYFSASAGLAPTPRSLSRSLRFCGCASTSAAFSLATADSISIICPALASSAIEDWLASNRWLAISGPHCHQLRDSLQAPRISKAFSEVAGLAVAGLNSFGLG